MLRLCLGVVTTLAVLSGLATSTVKGQCTEYQLGSPIETAIPSTAAHPIDFDGNAVVVGFGNPFGDAEAKVLRNVGGTWVEEAILVGSTILSGSGFAKDVAIDGDVIVVGAPGPWLVFEGSAFVFRFDGTNWIEEQELVAAGIVPGDTFGVAVDVKDDVIAIAAYHVDGPVPNCGAVYVFRYDGSQWVEEQQLFASDASNEAIFGDQVVVDDDLIVIGASQHPSANIQNGQVYTFEYDGTSWTETNIFTAPFSDGWCCGQRFGSSLALDGNRLAIGASGFDIPHPGGTAYGAGCVFTYEFDGSDWDYRQQIVIDDLEPFESPSFGSSVSLAGDRLVAGAPNEDIGLISDVGAIYVYEHDGSEWSQRQKILPTNPGGFDSFGETQATNGSWIFAERGGVWVGPPSGPLTLVPPEVTVYQDLPCPTAEFIRGDVNGDGQFSALADAYYLLTYQFVIGSPAPPCFSAADSDDSGDINALADSVYLLTYQFSFGSPAPPPPGVITCGPDPTADGLTCDTPPCP